MNNPTVSAQQPVSRANTYLAKAVYAGSNHTDTCRPATGIRQIRNITSFAPMMQLSNLYPALLNLPS